MPGAVGGGGRPRRRARDMARAIHGLDEGLELLILTGGGNDFLRFGIGRATPPHRRCSNIPGWRRLLDSFR